MQIAILSRNASLYSTRRLVQASRQQGHRVEVIDTLAVAVQIGLPAATRIPQVNPPHRLPLRRRGHWGQRRLAPYTMDGIIPRIGASITHFGVAVVRHLERQGVLTTATASGISQSRDKLQSLQLMGEAGLPVPQTAVVARPETMRDVLAEIGTPVIIKLLQSTQGRGVFLAPNVSTALAVMEKLQEYKRQALVQEFIAEAEGEDVRIIVIGGECAAAMRRIAAAGEFRSNLHRGGTAVAISPTPELERLAIAAAEAHDLAVAGVDIIMSSRGPLLLEVNSSPGLEGIERASGRDVAGAIIRYLGRQ